MKVVNVHQRELEAPRARVGSLLDSLASEDDRLWSGRQWPRMKLDRPLEIGASGGHGPIRYFVEEYTPGSTVRFRFTGPRGFGGFHGCEVVGDPEGPTILRHVVKMRTRGLAVLSWPLIFGPMHDALLEDALAGAQASLGLTPVVEPWSIWVRLLRWVGSGGKAPRQEIPSQSSPSR